MKRIDLFITAICLIVFIGCNAEINERSPLLFVEDRKWGLMDREGNILVKPEFKRIYDYTDGVALVVQNGKMGFMDNDGNWLIKPKYEKALNFTEGLASVQTGGKWGYIDKTGKTVIAPQYEMAWRFGSGLAAVSQDNQVFYINKKGDPISLKKMTWAGTFSEGIAAIRTQDKGLEVIDKKGNTIAGPELQWVGRKSRDGLFPVRKKDITYYIDSKGKTVIEIEDKGIRFAEPFSDGLARVNKGSHPHGMFARWGYADQSGRIVIQCQYTNCHDFTEELAAVNFSNQYQLEDALESGRIVTVGKWGYINKSGKIVIEPMFEMAYPFNGGVARVKIGEKVGYINKAGELLWNLSSP